jgi:hypothetical protein
MRVSLSSTDPWKSPLSKPILIFQHVVLSAGNGAIAGRILGIIGQVLLFFFISVLPILERASMAEWVNRRSDTIVDVNNVPVLNGEITLSTLLRTVYPIRNRDEERCTSA